MVPQQPPTSLSGLLANKLAPKPANPQDQGVIFSSYHEVKSVSLDAVPEATFEVPTDYKKVEGNK